MGIKRYVSTQDSTITDAFQDNFQVRATGSNMGVSDSLEVFSVYAEESAASIERSRILLQFPLDVVASDRSSGIIPSSGNIKFFLKLSNAVHPFTVPKKFTLNVQAVSSSWDEGYGLDMEGYKDIGVVNWASSSANTPWLKPGGDFHTSPVFSQYFENGTEDLNIEITSLVEDWLAGAKINNGVVVKLVDNQETGSISFYTKKFFSRGSEFFYKRPWIEAQFDSSKKDDRNSFFNSSSLAPAADNLNLLYLYNRHRGKLVNIPAVGSGLIYVSLYSGSSGPEGSPLTLQGGATAITGGFVSTGVYSASVALNTDLSYVFDVWHNNNGTQFVTGSAITILDPTLEETSFEIPEYVLNIKNLKQSYSTIESARFSLFVRPKNWSPTIFTIATNSTVNTQIEDAYFKIFRISDNLEVIPYGTGSMQHTRLSADGTVNYFDLNMDILEPNYSYGIKFLFFNAGNYYEQKELFKFRVN